MLTAIVLLPVLLVSLTQGQGIDSCVGRCDNLLDTSFSCQCNIHCERYGDCCNDYYTECLNAPAPSCSGRCDDPLDSNESCQCNTWCVQYNDCCPDYEETCNSPGGGTGSCSQLSISDAEILQLSLELWNLDNNVKHLITLDEQFQNSGSQDTATRPFFANVDESIFNSPTFAALKNLLDNYEKFQGNNENFGSNEIAEQDIFLDAVLATPIGQKLYEFLDSKGRAGCDTIETFKEYLRMQWFELYSRQNGAMDTSGFEHVFVGEIKSNYVSGFHGWVNFYLEEQKNELNYYGYVSKAEPDLYGNRFTWGGYTKELGSISVGASPELELAFFTLCHMARPGAICKVKMLDGNTEVTREIQTWTWSNSNPGSGLQYVASAYFRV